MESSVRRGRRGEAFAAAYLESVGWRILDRNWRDGPREIDLVILRNGVVAFVEVKARTDGCAGSTLEAIHAGKRREIERAARRWIRERAPEHPGVHTLRFDAVGVRILGRDRAEIRHVQGAWWTGE